MSKLFDRIFGRESRRETRGESTVGDQHARQGVRDITFEVSK